MGNKERAIAATHQLIYRIDEQLERAEESGCRAEQFSQLSRAMVAAQKRLYRLNSKGTIVMAQVADSYVDGHTVIVYGQPADVRAKMAARTALYGVWGHYGRQ